MATVIDQLVVTLDLDSKKFEQGIVKAAGLLNKLSAAAKGMQLNLTPAAKQAGEAVAEVGDKGERAGARVERGFGSARMGVYAFIAAVYKLNESIGFPAIRRMTQEVVDSEAETFRMAKSLRLNSTELQAWGKTVQIHGGDIHSFNSSLEKMEANLGKLGTQVRGAKILQQYLGLSGITDAMVKGKDAFSVLTLFANQMQSMSVERQFLVGKRLGLDEATIRTLQEGGPAILETVQRMRELAATQEELKNAKEVAVAQAEANIQWERAKQVLATAFIPALRTAADMLAGLSGFVREHKTVVVSAMIGIGTALLGFAAIAAIAAAGILASGFEIATGMTLATGGAWAIGAAAGIAALTAVAAAAGETAEAFNQTRDAHHDMVDEIINGDKKLEAMQAARKREVEWRKENAAGMQNIMEQQREASAALREQRGSFLVGAGSFFSRHFGEGDYARIQEGKEAELVKKIQELDALLKNKVGLIALADASLLKGKTEAWKTDYSGVTGRLEQLNAAQAHAVSIGTITVNLNGGKEVDISVQGNKVIASSSVDRSVHQIGGGTR